MEHSLLDLNMWEYCYGVCRALRTRQTQSGKLTTWRWSTGSCSWWRLVGSRHDPKKGNCLGWKLWRKWLKPSLEADFPSNDKCGGRDVHSLYSAARPAGQKGAINRSAIWWATLLYVPYDRPHASHVPGLWQQKCSLTNWHVEKIAFPLMFDSTQNSLFRHASALNFFVAASSPWKTELKGVPQWAASEPVLDGLRWRVQIRQGVQWVGRSRSGRACTTRALVQRGENREPGSLSEALTFTRSIFLPYLKCRWTHLPTGPLSLTRDSLWRGCRWYHQHPRLSAGSSQSIARMKAAEPYGL